MKCLVLSFLMGYNDHVYKRGEYVNIEDDMAVKRLVSERCIALLPLKESSEIEEKAEEKRQERKQTIRKQSKIVKRGVKKSNGRNN